MARQYLKLFTDLLEDARIAVLTDSEFRLVLTTWIMAKRQKPQGSFASMRHLKAITPQRLHRHYKALFACGLLQMDGERIVVDNWATLQIDPTAAIRQRRHREHSVTETHRLDSVTVTGDVTPGHGGRLRDLETMRHRDLETKRQVNSNKPELIGNLIKGVLK